MMSRNFDATQAGILKALRDIHYKLLAQQWSSFSDFQKMFVAASAYPCLTIGSVLNEEELVPLFRQYFEDTVLKFDVDPKFYDDDQGSVIRYHFDYFLSDRFEKKYCEYNRAIVN